MKKFIRITIEEYNDLKAKAEKWDHYHAGIKNNLPNERRTPAERSEAARKAVNARWKKYRENKEKAGKTY